MTRPGLFLIALLLGVIGILWLENHAVREDQAAMKHAYGTFLAQKIKGRPLVELIKPGSLAVLRTKSGGAVGCAAFR